jgi:hypothetical protein
MFLRGQRGEGRISFIITLAVFLSGVFVAVKVVPVKISGYQFREALRDEARRAVTHRQDERIVDNLMDTAAALEIPIERGGISILRTKKEVIITAKYEQAVDLKVTKYTYRFDAKQKAPLF